MFIIINFLLNFSLIGVLLVSYNRLIKAEPVTVTTDLTECKDATISNCASSGEAIKYCYKDDKIYALDAQGTCTTQEKITLTSGVKIFDFTTKAEAVMTSALSNLATIVPFNCVESGTIKCKRTYDYVKTDSKFYRIGANGKNEVADSTDTSVFNFVEPGKYILNDVLHVCCTNPIVCIKDDGTNDGINVFKVLNDGNNTIVKLVKDLTSVDLESEKYQLFDCKSAVCERTSGYIKYGKDFSNIGRCPDNADCTVQTEADNTGLERYLYNSNGILKYTGNDFTFSTKGGQLKVITTGNNYFFDEEVYNKYCDYISFSNSNVVAFTKYGKFIEIKILY